MPSTRRLLISLASAVLALAASAAPAAELVFTATLNGAAQLPEPVNTKAEGTLRLAVSDDGKQIAYTLTVANIANPAAADIHLGSPTQNGPVVVKLFPMDGTAPKQGPFNGVLAEGTINAANLTGPLAGGGLSDLVEQLQQGNVYANVHTNDGKDPPNSGPGDYRLGEIRGQLK
jgi:hypothetical protein